MKVTKLFWRISKVGIAGGSVYLTVDQGFWGDADSTAKTYNRLVQKIPSSLYTVIPIEYVSKYLPAKESMNFKPNFNWNSGVFIVCNFISDFPSKAVVLKDYLYNFAMSYK